MLITLSTIRQLPQAFALADSFIQYTPDTNAQPQVLIGLVDDPTQLPAGFSSPYPLLPIREILSAAELEALSATYTPTEFTAACKPLFIKSIFKRYSDENTIIYADPNTWFTASSAPIERTLSTANVILTQLITRSPSQPGVTLDSHWPDEKAFQNVGLYSSDFLAFRRSAETERLLTWWDDRVRTRAYINACEGLCLDQIWLMHVPIFFREVAIIKNPGWHVALWNLSERTLRQEGSNWLVNGPAGENQPLQFINFKGLLNPDEGLFPYQNRLRLNERPEITTLLSNYRKVIAVHANPALQAVKPTYGQQLEPVVLRGWRYATAQSLRAITRFIDKVPLPALR